MKSTNRWHRLALGLSLLATLMIGNLFPVLAQEPSSVTPQTGNLAGLNFIFAEKTSDEYVGQTYAAVSQNPGLSPFNLTNHWNPAATATGNGGSAQGDSLTLTWSIIPDGTSMPSQFTGDTTCSSNLIAEMDANYGAGNWQNEIAKVFADWSKTTGNIYVRENADDGAAWPNSSGAVGVRGDLRIGGCTIDGNSGILAYNFFPSNGDMKIDAPDSFYNNPATLTTTFHNVISHEHGHGAGVLHVCPVNQTKLMEPFVSSAFVGLQHDDIRAIQRHYGDRNEKIGLPNDSAGQATNLGTPVAGAAFTTDTLSIDDNGDQDWFLFTSAGTNQLLDVTLSPLGQTYLSGTQNNDGSCSAGSSVNSAAIHNLGIEVRDANGTTILATANSTGAGGTESLTGVALGSSGVKYIRIFGDTTDNIQLYNLQFTVRTVSAAIDLEKSPALQTVAPGGTANFQLAVSNVGGTTLANVTLTDAQCTTGPTFTGGDSNANGLLDSGEAWLYACSITNVQSGFINMASVSATTQDGATTVSDTDSATVNVAVVPPTAPGPLTATVASATQINLVWNDNSADETGFRIERCNGAACSNFAQIATVGANIASFANSGLTAGTTYRYRVFATNAGGDSTPSNIVNATPVNPPPAAPSNLTATPASPIQINLSWTDNATNELNYRVERCNNANCIFSQIASLGANITSYSSTGLTNNTTYCYRVRASNSQGNSAYSPTACATTPALPPAAPSNLAAVALSASQIRLTWADRSNNESGFKIESCQVATGTTCNTFLETATVAANINIYIYQTLAAGTRYCHRTRAYNPAGNSTYSNISCATTNPAAPSNLNATVVTRTRIDLSWVDNSSNETNFRLDRCLVSTVNPCTGFTQRALLGSNVVAFSDTPVLANRTYCYRVRSQISTIGSSYTAPVCATTVLPSSANAAVVDNQTEVSQPVSTDLLLQLQPQNQQLIHHRAACGNEVQPSAVTLLVGEVGIPMQPVTEEDDLYSAIINVQDQFATDASYPLLVRWSCANVEGEIQESLGVVTIVNPESETALNQRVFLPVIASDKAQ